MMDSMALPPSSYYSSPQPSTMSPDPLIDPTLAIDPAILGPSCDLKQSVDSPYPPRLLSPTSVAKFQLEQAPQGDPFAPQQNDTFFQPHLPSPPRPLKRKRKLRQASHRDEECSFCQGNDSRNKSGQPEMMVSCVACGRSGHPSCLGIEGIVDVLRSYPWHCIECKICEVCEKKGNGSRMLFCDACDRGWHMDCLQPPLSSTPDGSWICPVCPPVPLSPQADDYPPSLPHPVSPSPTSSIASSSRLAQPSDLKSRTRPTGKLKRKALDNEDVDDNDPHRIRHATDPEGRPGHRKRNKMKNNGTGLTDVKGKGKARTSQAPEDLPPRSHSSMKSRSYSPDPRPPPQRKVRLVVRKPKVVLDEEENDEDDDDGSPTNMFEGVLKPEEYSTANTRISDSDKALFTRSRTRAEHRIEHHVVPPSLSPNLVKNSLSMSSVAAGPSTTTSPLHSLRTRHAIAQAFHLGISAESRTPPGTPNTDHQAGFPPRIRTIRFGEYDVDTWYDAPFPEEYASVPDAKLWICEFCLKYTKSRFQSTRHRMKCKARHPPGDEIYRDGTISVFEVDGRKNKIYCQNLCLLSKMFLDHKSLFYDVEPFLFYVMTEVDRLGARFVGYFSKEKRSPKDYNVSCIMTLPVRQRKGWGNILIDFSYLLSRKEGRVGTPEKPLSALGTLAYKQYWVHTIKLFLHTASEPVSLEDISRATSMTLEDIYNTLRDLDFITAKERTPPPPPRPPPGTPIKYLRGRKNGPGISRRGLIRTNAKDDSKAPPVIPTEYTIHWNSEELDAYFTAWRTKEHLTIQPRCLKWSPFLLARTSKGETLGEARVETVNAQRETGGNVATELDRSSASSTKVTQNGFHDVAVSTPKLPGEPSPTASPQLGEVQPPVLTEVEDSELTIHPSTPPKESQTWQSFDSPSEQERLQTLNLVRSTRSDTLRRASVDPAGLPPLAPAVLPERSLRPRTSVKNLKRKRNEEAAKNTAGTIVKDDDISRDSALAARLAREEGARRTRSMLHKTDPPKAPISHSPTRKHRRVEVSISAGLDAEGSLSELTHSSKSPSPPPRHHTRGAHGRFRKAQVPSVADNTPPKNLLARSSRTGAQSTGARLSSRINDTTNVPIPASQLKDIRVVVEDTQARTRSTRRTKAELSHDDSSAELKISIDKHHRQLVSAHQSKAGEEDNKAIDMKADKGLPTTLNTVEPTLRVDGTGGISRVLYDEDALGEEDAEGEEDPNPSDVDR